MKKVENKDGVNGNEMMGGGSEKVRKINLAKSTESRNKIVKKLNVTLIRQIETKLLR